MVVEPIKIEEYKTETTPTWCPGCGDFAVLRGIHTALARLKIKSEHVVISSGIGCSSNLPGFVNAYGFHGLHGRSLPIANGIKLANTDLTVIATGGDGDGYGIGLGHFIHSMRRNINITYIVMNNQIYGLTTGQASPTSERGMLTKSTPSGLLEVPVNPIALALISGATYVSRGFSGNADHLSTIIENALSHKGFSLVDVLSPCVTYNKIQTYQWFRDRVYTLEDEEHDTNDLKQALSKSYEWESKIPIGVFYKADKPTYDGDEPALQDGPLVNQPLDTGKNIAKQLLDEFT
ncbi:MAG: thiamine pyrophosphate-dependent enzyme [Nitrososphaerales archaeon]|uniref:2-oxoacid ferredoxin oxidoreductase subunit beta (KorB) n=1 Tax=uncultured marine thaumarchaeote AD1000_19_G07 TaxID=1455897 RepID=A0A075FL82_9ARCH|nr:2-oxoacid ferredoxin oxidoreductase subunit beta (korB) [uncultured marine thaumarchaeote AD1000_19_G07]